MNEIDSIFIKKIINTKNEKDPLRYSIIESMFNVSGNDVNVVSSAIADTASEIYNNVIEIYAKYDFKSDYLSEIVPRMIGNHNETIYKSVDMDLDNVISFCTNGEISEHDRVNIVEKIIDNVLNSYSIYSIDNMKKVNIKSILEKNYKGIDIDLSLLSNTRASLLRAIIFFEQADDFLCYQVNGKSDINVDRMLEKNLLNLKRNI